MADTALTEPARRRRKQARPAELLQAALDCFVEKGFAATRMDDIAHRAGVSKGTIYLYYPSKQAVFEAMVRENLLPRLQAAEGLAALGGSAASRLRQILAQLAEVVGDPRRAAIPKLVVAEAGNFPDMARFYRREVIGRGLGLVAAILRDGIAQGEFRPVEPEITARLFIAPVLMNALWLTTFAPIEEAPLPVATVLAHHGELFLRALAPDIPQEAVR